MSEVQLVIRMVSNRDCKLTHDKQSFLCFIFALSGLSEILHPVATAFVIPTSLLTELVQVQTTDYIPTLIVKQLKLIQHRCWMINRE